MNKLLRKLVLVRKSLFHWFWYQFLTFSFLHRKLAIQICFCKVAGEKGKNFLPESFSSYQKGISPMDVFIILHFLEVYASATIDFRVRTRRGKKHYYKKHKQIIYINIFNIINILTWLSADAKSAILLRVPSSTKVQVCNFSLLHFPRWLCLVKFQCFCLFDIQQSLVLS